MAITRCGTCGLSLMMQKAPRFKNKLWLVPTHHGPCDSYLCVGSSKDGPTCPMGPIHDCFACQIEAKGPQPFTREFFEKIKEKYR